MGGGNHFGPPNSVLAVGASSPEFSSRIENITVNVGREAVLECRVSHLGRYKVRQKRKAASMSRIESPWILVRMNVYVPGLSCLGSTTHYSTLFLNVYMPSLFFSLRWDG